MLTHSHQSQQALPAGLVHCGGNAGVGDQRRRRNGGACTHAYSEGSDQFPTAARVKRTRPVGLHEQVQAGDAGNQHAQLHRPCDGSSSSLLKSTPPPQQGGSPAPSLPALSMSCLALVATAASISSSAAGHDKHTRRAQASNGEPLRSESALSCTAKSSEVNFINQLSRSNLVKESKQLGSLLRLEDMRVSAQRG